MILARDPLDELRRAFRLFDTENKGKINIRDLKRVAKELGEGLSEDELSVLHFIPLYRNSELNLRRYDEQTSDDRRV